MSEKKQIIKRGKITYYISESAVVVGIGRYQFVSYNVYNSPSRSSLADFKRRIINSKPDQYGNATDQVDLARRCNLIGTGTVKPKWGGNDNSL
jgi:hypothetical protein